ncbi:MAG: DUF72 domain-containing protein, partial [Longimicrobiales bacterium]
MKESGRTPVRVGVAGWDYKDWKGIVYPDPRPRGFDPLTYLAGYLDLIEINTTHYGPATVAVARKWVRRVGDASRFRFTAKLWRRFTHERKEPWTRVDVRDVRRGFDVLHGSGRLDAMLAQFPWSFKNVEASREWLDDIAGAFADYPLVIEVRHESWNSPEFLTWLAERGIGFVNLDQPLFSKSIKPSAHVTAAAGYVRVHGRNYSDWFRKNAGRDARYDYLYEPAELRPWVKRTKQAAEHGSSESVDVVFNNHYKGKAMVNALQFRKLLEGSRVDAPPPLVEAYTEELKGYARAVKT